MAALQGTPCAPPSALHPPRFLGASRAGEALKELRIHLSCLPLPSLTASVLATFMPDHTEGLLQVPKQFCACQCCPLKILCEANDKQGLSGRRNCLPHHHPRTPPRPSARWRPSVPVLPSAQSRRSFCSKTQPR